MKKEKTLKEIIQVMEYKGKTRGAIMAEVIDSLSYLMESDRILIIDEEDNGGCTSIFIGTKNVSDQICDYLDEIDVPYSAMAKTHSEELQ